MKSGRRNFILSGVVALCSPALAKTHKSPLRMGLTPVFLDNDALVIERLRKALATALGRSVELEQRRTYKEVTSLLLEGALDAAWLCGYPFLQHEDHLSVISVPVWRGRPLYQSYLIVGDQDNAETLEDLRGDIHAFSDPDSNSGFLVTASDLAKKGLKPDEFFGRTIFTYGHRNVVRAVAAGLVRSGSVDGYVWEVLAKAEPALPHQTKVIARSEWLGFPPICARKDRVSDADISALAEVLLEFDQTAEGMAALDLLQLDRMSKKPTGLYDGIRKRMRILRDLG